MTSKLGQRGRATRLWGWTLCVSLMAACGADGGPAGDPQRDSGTGEPGGQGGGGANGGEGGGITGGTGGDQPGGSVADAGPGGTTPDAMIEPDAMVAPLLDCAAACGALFGCVSEHSPFDEANCLAECEADASNGARPFRRCVGRAGADCDAVAACGWPDFIDTPDCAGTCAAAASCPNGLQLPEGACEALCAGDQGAGVVACAEHVFDVACDGTAFQGCLAAQLPVCVDFCDAAPGCGFATPERCGADCLSQILQDDPLAGLRQTEVLECIGRAGANCAAANQCVSQGQVLDEAGFCDAWTMCGFDFQFGPCQDLFGRFLPPGVEFGDYAVCLSRAFDNGCPPDGIQAIFNCIGGQPAAPDCAGDCEARAVCGLLPEGQDAMACTRACFAEVGANPDAAAALADLINCGAFAANCDDLVECRAAQDPAARCAAACANAVECGTEADAALCEAACTEGFATALWQSWLTCEDTAADCDTARQCSHEPPLGCDPYCTRRIQCGLEVDRDTCMSSCVSTALADPAGSELRIACTVAALDCGVPGGGGVRPPVPPGPPVPVPAGLIDQGATSPTVWNCEFDAYTYGMPCAASCRGTTLCAGGDEAAWLACVTDCHAAPEDDADLIRLAGLACFHQNGRNGSQDCSGLVGCAPDPAALDCDAYCGRLADCGRVDADCAANCAAVTPARLNALRSATCVADAAACEDVLLCVDGQPEVGPADVPEVVFCPAWDACAQQWGFPIPCDQLDAFFGGRGDLAAVRACIYPIIANGCPPGPDEVFNNCLGGGPAPVDPECEAFCAAEQLCGPADDVNRGGCAIACGNLSFMPPLEIARAQSYYPCAHEATCQAFDACVAGSSPEARCADSCDALAGCGLAADVDACNAECLAGYGGAARTIYRDCVAAAGADCAAMAACEDPAVAYCLQTCTVYSECQNGDPQAMPVCMAACEDDAALDAFAIANRAVCVLEADSCQDANGGIGVFACWDRFFDIAPDTCAQYCWGRSGCEGGTDFEACVLGCANGLPAEDAVVLAQADACLSRANGACMAIQACLSAVPAEVPCPLVCNAVSGCGLEADADCNAACADVSVAGCVLEAQRRPGQCGAMAACLGVEVAPPSADCAAYCDRTLTCGNAQDRFLCERDCAADPAVMASRAGCAAASTCGQLAACAGLPARADAGCDAPCVDAVACGAFADADLCGAYCGGAVASPTTDADYPADVVACLGDLGGACDGESARGCFAPNVHDCASVCALLNACMPIPDCEVGCQQALAQDPIGTERVFDCAYQFLDGALCDLRGFEGCTNL